MENMLDTPHLPWVHRGTIGAELWKRMRPDSRMTQEVTETPWGFEDRFQIDDGPGNQINWRRPNGMELFILETPARRLRAHAWCVPTTTDHTRMIVVTATDFGWLNLFAGFGRNFNKRVLGEDRAVLESSFPVRVPPPDTEQNVPTDKVTLRFRTWYLKTLADGEPPEKTPPVA
jgi:phenylpropionate dioxygenase-like ring-hydroxylating dioxygenase large terminal subunit